MNRTQTHGNDSVKEEAEKVSSTLPLMQFRNLNSHKAGAQVWGHMRFLRVHTERKEGQDGGLGSGSGRTMITSPKQERELA